MGINTVVYGWKRCVPGREASCARHIDEFTGYLTGLKKDGSIASYDTVLLEGDTSSIGGFFLVKGEEAKLGAILASPAFSEYITRGVMDLEETVLSRGVSGPRAAERVETLATTAVSA
jgi:hypothetical protein